MTRDTYLDYARGILAISIIYIHTVWWSGSSYVPEYVRNLALLIDVPMFTVIAGASYYYVKNIKKGIKNLFRLQVNYMYYMLILSVLLLLFKETVDTKMIFGNWMMHNRVYPKNFQVAFSSMWYILVYIYVSLIGMLLCKVLNRKSLAVALFLNIVVNVMFNILPIQVQYTKIYMYDLKHILFYLQFWLMGYLIYEYDIKINYKIFGALITTISVALLLFYMKVGNKIFDIQGYKFPPQLIYFVWSLYSVSIFVFLRDKVKVAADTHISRIGKKAIDYYFAQGISSYLIYFVLEHLSGINLWGIRLAIAFSINVFLAIIISYLINKSRKIIKGLL